MILDIDKIEELIKKPKYGDLIDLAVEKNSRLAMHINGVNAEEAIEELSGIESEPERELRKRLVRSNRAIFGTLLRPFDKTFSAKGGSVFYDVADVNEFTNYLSRVNGIGLRQWLKKRWKNKMFTDPNGVILIEINSNGEPNPKYKAITTIHDYCPSGILLEYIIFKPFKGDARQYTEVELDKDAEYYRVIDDEKDVIVRYKDEKATIVEELLIKNEIGKIPAVLCSDLLDPESTLKMSPVEDVIDLADEYLRDTSIHTIYKALHSYPIFWAYLPDCIFCDGTGKIDNNECSHCHGYGKDIRKDVSKIFGLDIPNADETNIAPPAGYVQPDVASWTQQRTELDWLQRLMHFTLWGTFTREQATNETATGRFLDAQPVHDRIDEFSETAETIEQHLTDFIGAIMYGAAYKGSSVGLGRRYAIESADAIWIRYQSAREKGSPVATLDYMLEQFYESEFRSQPSRFDQFVRLMFVEPFIHMTAEQVEGLSVEAIDKLKKYYFTEWLGSKESGYVIMTDINKMRDDLKLYVTPKQTKTTEL